MRGFAALVVLGHNLGWKWLPGGFLSVDVFFALSGFLITTVLLEEFTGSGAISLPTFFLRRCLRLYPALIVLVACVAVAAIRLHPTASRGELTLIIASTLGYFSNWIIAANPKAWDAALGHTWSLAVEAQFYVLWALTVAAITRRRGLDWSALIGVASLVAIGSAVFRATIWLITRDSGFVYAATGTRLDSLFLGASAALIRIRHLTDRQWSPLAHVEPRSIRALEALCLGGLVTMFNATPQSSPLSYLGEFGLAGAATSLLILTSLCCESSFVAKLASAPLLCWFGSISYSIYLWHLPIARFVSARRFEFLGLPQPVFEVARAATVIVIAAGSYYGIERSFIRRKKRLLASRGG